MNGAPGGRQQCGAAPQKRGPASSFRAPQQHPSTTGTIFPQADDAAPNGQQVGHIIPPPQALSLGTASSTQQPSSSAVRDPSALSLPLLQSAALQQSGGWPPHFDLQSIYSSQLQSAQSAAALRFGQQPARSQPSHLPQPSQLPVTAQLPQTSPLTAPVPLSQATQLSQPSPLPHAPQAVSASVAAGGELGALCGSPRSCSLAASPATGGAATTSNLPTLSMGAGAVQMLAAGGSLNPAFLAQYQLLIAAAAQQQQQAAAAAAAALAAASAAHHTPIGTRMSTSPVSTLAPFEQNLQRYMLQLQQQQQLAAASAHVVPSSPLHTPSPLPAHMQAAIAASFPQSPIAQVSGQSRAAAVASPTGGQAVSLGSRTLSDSAPSSQQPLLARLAQRHSSTSLTGSLSSSTLPSTSTLHSRHAQNRGSLMPPPPIPRSRHASLSLPSTSQIRQRPSVLPYQRPAPSTETSFEMGSLPPQPYYPTHFMRGTVIRLQSGQLKRVEEMSTNDFVLSAAMKSDLSLCNSTVVSIQEADKGRHVLVTFAVGEQNIQVSIEASIEHPYFVVGQGWASCSPEKTRDLYGLICKRLAVGDVCITIRHIDKGEERACCSSEGAAGPSSQQISQPAERMDPARGSRVGRDDSGGGWRSAPPYRPPIDPSAIPPEPTRQRRKSST
uniref:AXH domain-containing protein n=2 Tax=Ascaris TaxID=6251 RepID=A0A0M3HQM6_ASCLU